MEIRNGVSNIKSTNRSSDDKKIISGYAIKWDSWSKEIREDGKVFRERFKKGAFKESLEKHNQLALCRHQQGQSLGSVDERTLSLEEDEVGLAFKIILPDSGFGKRTFREVENGSLPHASIGFMNAVESWSKRDGKQHRTITKADLGEISLVGAPAYEDTVVKCGDKRGQLNLIHKIDQSLLETKRSEVLQLVNAALKKHG